MSRHSKACCNIAPKASPVYNSMGEFAELDGLKTYKTGPSSAKKAILIVYDIFGFSPQSLQGADLLAYGNKDEQYQVYVPDFLLGQYADHTWFPPDTAEKGQAMGEFFQGPANPITTVQKIPALVQTITASSSGSIESWAILGKCWGGKIVSFSCGDGTPFKAAAEVHPSMIDPSDAPGIKIPIAILASGDENAEDVKSFVEALKVPYYSETFADQVHGWMAARGDLVDQRSRAEYERGYATLLRFFAEYF
ncbi:alpha/beta-hydrolase [Aureobasidium pullulans]|uniref:Alpha/beta-hydrolase n=1 Tax=Aureobasidium pullulans TaxID=5580 RepID=A0A4S9QRA3_AURPU|nr:alpha/beta-hydrolase [Aureobasidium pullulans]THV91729.1 alpha/beta-hydrolase [Aureobasidium pullulans]THV91831.1 alpha/beta-hydrolase [Aureobasidium pullulans]THW11083.1 alpha/beta-hydrolase [Aureobasidium pullulans]THW27173.1 alpha/beta-hydrolase [Aureobasidium pullulans]